MRFISLICIVLLIQGCAEMKTLGDDYLGVKDYNKRTMKDSGKDFKYDVIGVERPLVEPEEKEELFFLARDRLMTTEYYHQFFIDAPILDANPGMPEAHNYYFVLFTPEPGLPELEGKYYLVVFGRQLPKAILYDGLFAPAKGGDPFYRYKGIIDAITLQN